MENIGIINSYGVLNGSDLNNTDYLKQAYELGKSLQEADYANIKIK